MLFKNIVKSALYTAVIVSLGCLATSCKEKPKENTADEHYVLPDSLVKTLKTDTVKYRPVVDAMTLTGNVDFNQDHVVRMYPMLSGNLQGVKVMLGDYVKAGQVLGYINSTEVAGMGNDLINAQSSLTLAKKSLDAAKDMFKSGLSSQNDLLQAETNYTQAKANLSHVQTVMNLQHTGNGTQSVIKAPISGFVVEKFVTNNTSIRPDNSNPMFTISDLKNVWVMANVYESNLQKVKVGDRVEVTTLSYPDRVFNGKVDEMMNVLDPQSKVMKLKVVLDNSDYALKPQMFASVRVIQNEGGSSLSISSHSLIFDNSQYYVLVYKSPSDIRIVPVTIVNNVGDIVYITSGVQPGDILVSSNALLIYQSLNG